MPVKALYRINGGEVIKLRDTVQTFQPLVDTGLWAVLTDPTTPDGLDVRDESGDESGPLKELGFAKIAEPLVGPNGNVRNATAGEITAFIAAETVDGNDLDAAQASQMADIDPVLRKIFKALLKQLIAEIFEGSNVKVHEMIAQWEQHKADIASASNLGALKTSTAALPVVAADLKTTVTLAQAVTKLKADILPDD
jgi:hypothetical protein